MKRNRFGVAALIGFVAFLYSCNDIIVKDISGSEVTLLSPQDSAEFTTASYTFWWNPVEAADGYQLIVVSPNLAQANHVALDTTVTKDSFTYPLPVGQYQWCVRAVNSGYQTAYSCRVITIK